VSEPTGFFARVIGALLPTREQWRQFITQYKRLLTYAWRYRWLIALSIACGTAVAASAAGLAAIMKPMMDEGFIKRSESVIRNVPLIIIGLAALRGFASFGQEYSMRWVGRKVVFDMRQEVFAHMLRLPAGFFDRTPSGTLLARLIFNLEQISTATVQSVLTVISDGLTVLVLLVYLLYIDWRLTVVLYLVVPVAMVLARIMSKRFRKTSREIQRAMGEVSREAQESIAGYRVMRAFGAERTQLWKFGKANDRHRRQVMRKSAVAAIGQPLIQFVAVCGMALVIFLWLNAKGATPGTFVAYIIAVTMMMNPIKQLTKVNEHIQSGLAAADSVFTILDTPTEVDQGTQAMENIKGRIEYRDVAFRYAGSENDALRDVSFTIEPGHTVALVGSSGSGKTTIANLLLRFYSPSRGSILIDGQDINRFTLESLRRQIGYVGQEALLFDDSIRRNVAFGVDDAKIDEAQLMHAVRAAHVLEFAERLPEGLDTVVGERGSRLSGGQRQRVAIARALYKDAPILILDEATSALDSESERLVQEAMAELTRNRTTLIIAHRLSTIEHAERVLVLSRGEIIESGTHATLLQKDGTYAKLYRNQFAEVPA